MDKDKKELRDQELEQATGGLSKEIEGDDDDFTMPESICPKCGKKTPALLGNDKMCPACFRKQLS